MGVNPLGGAVGRDRQPERISVLAMMAKNEQRVRNDVGRKMTSQRDVVRKTYHETSREWLLSQQRG
jgi:hypothetical protein